MSLTPVEALQREIVIAKDFIAYNEKTFRDPDLWPKYLAALELAKAEAEVIDYKRIMPPRMIWNSTLGAFENAQNAARIKLYEALQR